MDKKTVVAVLSDFGADSFYAGVMKGVVRCAAPHASVVDITHSIPPYAVDQGSFVLARIVRFFPRGSVFLAVVDPGVGGTRRNIIVESHGKFFVGPDNGIFTEVISGEEAPRAYVIDESRLGGFRDFAPAGKTFLGRDVFAPAAAAIASGSNPAEIAARAPGGLEHLEIPPVTVGDNVVAGPARYVDSFGNILTAVSGSCLRSAFGESLENIRARINQIDLGPLREFFGEAGRGTLAAILNSWDVVEISETQGRAADRFPGLGPGELKVELYAK